MNCVEFGVFGLGARHLGWRKVGFSFLVVTCVDLI